MTFFAFPELASAWQELPCEIRPESRFGIIQASVLSAALTVLDRFAPSVLLAYIYIYIRIYVTYTQRCIYMYTHIEVHMVYTWLAGISGWRGLRGRERLQMPQLPQGGGSQQEAAAVHHAMWCSLSVLNA